MNNKLDLFSFEHSILGEMLKEYEYPHQILPYLGDLIIKLGNELPSEKYYTLKENVWVSKAARISENVCINAPCIIGENTEIRPGAYIRGNAVIGCGCVIGNSTELKNVILFDKAQLPHYNYAGDSIIGYKSHLGASAITSNVRMDKAPVYIDYGEGRIFTGYKKLGAIIGDNVEIGCGAVLNPGTVIGRGSDIYPLSFVRGYVKANCIYKNNGQSVDKIGGI